MTANRNRTNALQFAVAGVLAATMLAGCSSASSAPRADASAAKAEGALAKGKVDKAVILAEAAVEAEPRDASYRATMGYAYLRAGRFISAATSFNDAMELGDNSARTALGLALSYVAAGRNQDAVAVLDDWRDVIPASDMGLAMALAGETSRGVAILTDTLRSGENTPKVRQNLAYAFALDGRWREARLMVERDVPADQVDARISKWAEQGRPEDYQRRVAGLLSVPMIANDPGQPMQLALANTPSNEQLAAEASALAPQEQVAVAAPVEEPVKADPQAAPAMALVEAPAAPATTTVTAPVNASPEPAYPVRLSFVSQPVSQPAPVRHTAAPAAAPKVAKGGTHLVQLGSFSSAQGARRAWGFYVKQNPELRNYRMTITPAVVRGKNYWRVAAGGLYATSAQGMCGKVKSRGGECFAYAAGSQRTVVPGVAPARGTTGPALARRR